MKHLLSFVLLLSFAIAPALAEDAKAPAKPAPAVKPVPQKDVERVLNETLADLPEKAAEAMKQATPVIQQPILISTNDALWFVLGHGDKEQTVSVYCREHNKEFRRIGESFIGPVLAASVFTTAEGKFETALHLFFPGSVGNHQLLTRKGVMSPQRNYPGTLRAVFLQYLLSDKNYEFIKGQWVPGTFAFSKTPTIEFDGQSYQVHTTVSTAGHTVDISSGQSHIQINRDNAPVVFPAAPITAAYGSELALVYRDGEKWKLLLANPISGTVLHEEVIRTSAASDSLRGVFELYNDFFLGVMIALFVVMFGLKPRKITRMAITVGPFRVAALWKRLVAVLIDYIPCSMIMSWILVPQDKMELLQQKIQANADLEELAMTMAPEGLYALIASLALLLVISTACEWKWGQTLGKRIMGIRVAADGSLQLNAREVLLRNLMKLLEFSALLTSHIIIRMILIAPPIFTPLHQRLGDMAARTVVIDVRIPPKPATVAPAGEQG